MLIGPFHCLKILLKQECIPVGCVPSACCSYFPASSTSGGVPARGVYLLGGVPTQGDVPAGGCTCRGGVPAQGCTYQGVYLLGVYLSGGVPALGGVPAQEGVPAANTRPRGVYLPRYSPLRTEFLTHATENITLPQTFFCGR